MGEPNLAAAPSPFMPRPSDAFVDDLRGRLVGTLVVAVGDHALAEEIAQEALTRVVGEADLDLLFAVAGAIELR